MAEDLQLLRQYAETHAEQAFAALVERHIALVYSAALRQLGGAAHRAEDVTQSVFVDLARKAAALSQRDDIVGWLYTSTHYAAAKLKRAEARRQQREQEAHTMHELLAGSSANLDWERVRPVLDEAMHELSEPDRQAILLRFFRNERFADVARRLGTSEDGARMRVDRGLEKLHALLAKRGITSTTVALSMALTNEAVIAAPAALATSVTAAVVGDAAGQASLAAFMTTSKITLMLAAAATLAIGWGIYQSSRARTTASELAAGRSDYAALTARLAEVQTKIHQEEQALQARAAALGQQRSAAVRASAAADVVADKELEAKALQQLIDSDPQLRQMWNDHLRHDLLFSWAPLFRHLRLTAGEIEQTLAELQRRRNLKVSDPDSRVGLPEALAADARFTESLKHRAARDLVEKIVRWTAPAGVAFTPEQTDQLFRTFVELGPPSLAPNANEKWLVLQANLDWGQVITQGGAYLDPEQIDVFLTWAAMVRRGKIFKAATQAAQ